MSTEFVPIEWDAYMDSEPASEWETPARDGSGHSRQHKGSRALLTEVYASEERDVESPEIENFPSNSLHEAALRTPLQNLLLLPATLRALRAAGLRTLADLSRLSPAQISELPGLGKKDLLEVEQLIEHFALPLAPARAVILESETVTEDSADPQPAQNAIPPMPEPGVAAIFSPPEAATGENEPMEYAAKPEAVPSVQLCLPFERIALSTEQRRGSRQRILPAGEVPSGAAIDHEQAPPQQKKPKRVVFRLRSTELNQICLDL